MNRDIAQRWVEALRSGDYTQGKRALAVKEYDSEDYSHCCLGVLCELAVADGVEVTVVESNRTKSYDGAEAALPVAVRRWAGVTGRNPVVPRPHSVSSVYDHTTLASINDVGLTFDQIADVIEQNMEDI